LIRPRFKYGYEEYHPRWGRLSVDQSLPYALAIIDQVLVPLHKSNITELSPDLRVSSWGVRFHFLDVADRVRVQLSAVQTCDSHMRNAVEFAVSVTCRAMTLWKRSGLQSEQRIPCVLCHMDLQPQNVSRDAMGKILFVFDWEEAAWADPTFELLLLC